MKHETQSTPATAALQLTAELVEFIESGVSIILAVVGADGRARAGRAVAVRVLAGSAVRVIYPAEGNDAITAAVAAGGPIAVTFSAPISHRTIQLKAMSTLAEGLEPEDTAMLGRQVDAFAAVLRAIGFGPAFVQAFCDNRSQRVHVLSFRPETAFEQTPGPGAGRAL